MKAGRVHAANPLIWQPEPRHWIAFMLLTQAAFWGTYAIIRQIAWPYFAIVTIATAASLALVLLLLLPITRFSRLQTIAGLFLLSIAVDAYLTAYGDSTLPYAWLPLLRYPVQYLLLLLSGLTLNALFDEHRVWTRAAIATYPLFCLAILAWYALGRPHPFITALDSLALLLIAVGGLFKLGYLARQAPALALRVASILMIGLASAAYDVAAHAVVQGRPPALDATALSPLFLMLGIVAELAVQGHRLNQEAVSARSDLERQLLEQDAVLFSSSNLLRHHERQIAVRAERQRFVRDLHDGAGGILTHLILNIRRNTLSQSEIEAELQGAADDLRNIAMAMDNADAPLDEALGVFVERMGPRLAQAGMGFDWNVDLPEEPPVIETRRLLHVYRILQEATTNVVRHAGARRLAMSVSSHPERGESWVRIMLADDGAGFDPAEPDADAGEGRGLANMSQRARLIEGELFLHSRPGGGTRLDLSFPIALQAP